MQNRFWLPVTILFVMTNLGCRVFGNGSIERQIEQTREAEAYPYAVYPISEISKAKLCKALALPAEDEICRPDTEVMHWDVVEKIEDEFPVGETQYREVEAVLESFPHKRIAPEREDGTLISLEYVYGLTEYEGACIYFHISLEDMSTVERIGASTPGRSGSGMSPTLCAAFRGTNRARND